MLPPEVNPVHCQRESGPRGKGPGHHDNGDNDDANLGDWSDIELDAIMSDDTPGDQALSPGVMCRDTCTPKAAAMEAQLCVRKVLHRIKVTQKVRGILYRGTQKVRGILYRGTQKVRGILYRGTQKVREILHRIKGNQKVRRIPHVVRGARGIQGVRVIRNRN